VLRDLLADRRLRRAWVLTKLGVLAAAALATWPLSRVIGPKAWLGYGVFVLFVVVTTAGLLASGRASSGVTPEGEAEDDSPDEPPPGEPVVVPIEDSLDLHPFSPSEIPDVVGAYLDEAVSRGFDEVRLIHGRGIGVQRERVRSLLAKHPAVVGYRDAPPERGGWGATVARLR
jgi:hypothetical protein